MSSDHNMGRETVERLAEEFVQRLRHGERPQVSEYVAQYPEHAEEISEVFPALLMMEELAPDEDTGPFGASDLSTDAGPTLDRLGDYRILREVGRGGMGIVYEAEQESLERRVALKVLPAHSLLEPKHLRRFEREARSAASLHHTNIVPVFGVGHDDGLHYYVMQFIQGLGLDEVLEELKRCGAGAGTSLAVNGAKGLQQPLSAAHIALSIVRGARVVGDSDATEASDRIASGRSADAPTQAKKAPSSVVLPGESKSSLSTTLDGQYWRSVAQIGVQVARALDYAHGQGTLHRDIKPANLLLDTRATVWITDFGLAKPSDSENLTNTGDIVGTIRYMAPERFQGQSDARGDIYSLGVTLYELLTLRPAFNQSERHELMRQVATQEPPLPRKLNPKVPRDLETIVLKSTAKEPGRRYATAGELAFDLERFINDQPIHARRTSMAGRLIRWARRNPGVAASLGCIGLLLIAASVISSLAAVRFSNLVDEKEHARVAESQQRLRAEANLYASHIGLADGAWKSNDSGRAISLLERCRPLPDQPDLRGWEWHYLNRVFEKHLLRVTGHTSPPNRRDVKGHGPVFCVAFSPDGQFMASAGGGNMFYQTSGHPVAGEVLVRHASSGELVHKLQGHRHLVTHVAFHPSEQLLASEGELEQVKLWDLEMGSLIAELPEGHRSVAFSPDGAFVATVGQDDSINLWGVPDLQLQHSWDGAILPADVSGQTTGSLSQVLFCPDGVHLAARYVSPYAPTTSAIRLWDWRRQELVREFNGHSAVITCMAFSPDGRRLASADTTNHILVRNVADDSGVRRIDHRQPVRCVAFSPDGQTLASAGTDHVVRTWDAVSGRALRTFRGHSGIVEHVAFHPDGHRLASASLDATVRVWDGTEDQQARFLPGGYDTGWNLDISFTKDGTALLKAGHEFLVEQDVTTGAIIKRHIIAASKRPIWPRFDFVFSADKTRLVAPAADDRSICVWDVATGELIRRLSGYRGTVDALAISADNRQIATAAQVSEPGNSFCEIKLWDTDSATVRREIKISSSTNLQGPIWFSALAFDSQGSRLAGTDNVNHTVRLWDTTSGRQLFAHADVPSCLGLAFSPDDAQLAVAGDKAVRVLDVDSGQQLFRLQTASSVTSVAYSPDGRRLVATGYSSDVPIWETETGNEILALQRLGPTPGTGGQNPRIVFSPDGNRLAARNYATSVTIWEIDPQETQSPAAPTVARRQREAIQRIHRAERFRGQNDLNRADRELQLAKQLAPTLADVFAAAARLNSHKRRWLASLQDSTRACQLRPNDALLLQHRAHALVQLHRWDEAADDLEAAVALGLKEGNPRVQIVALRAAGNNLESCAAAARLLWTEFLEDYQDARLVHVNHNVERFSPVRAKFVRFMILATSDGMEPCIDELEVFSAADGETQPRNVALSDSGARAAASGTIEGYTIHRVEHANDGQFGNSHSWISDVHGRGWVQIELAEPALIDRIVWSRDRETAYEDRVPICYRIEVAEDPSDWRLAAETENGKFFDSNEINRTLGLLVLLRAAVRDHAPLIDWLQRNVEHFSDNPESHLTLAAGLHRVGRFEEAMATLTHALGIAEDGTYSKAALAAVRSLTHSRLGDTQLATHWLEKAERWTDPALALSESGDFEPAASSWEQRIALDQLLREARAMLKPL